MNISLFGPQGSGKGTQARLLCERFGFFYFESGAYLRKIGEKYPSIKKSMDEGKLVPDIEFTSYLTAYLDDQSLYDGIVFDGFPRTLDQYKFLRNWLTDKEVKIDLAIIIKVGEEESVKRLSARLLDPETGNIYNLITEPPPPGVDVSKLTHRSDDMPDAIKRRLGLYHEFTEPLIKELSAETKVVEINGERSVMEVQNEIANLVEKMDNTDN